MESTTGLLPNRKQDPVILATSYSAAGHFTPLLQIAGYLAGRGYEVWFLAPHAVKASIEDAGCTFIQTVGAAGMMIDLDNHPGYAKSGLANVVWIYKDVWAGTMPGYLESLRNAMAAIRRAHPHRDVVMVMDAVNPGIIPLKMGAALPEGYDALPKTLGIGVIPPIFNTADRAPWGFGLPYDTSESARLRNIALCHAFRAVCEPAVEATNAMLRACGVLRPIDSVWGTYNTVPHIPVDYGIMCHDTSLQMCIPSLEYSLDELPPNIKFGGTLPPKPLPAGFQFPARFQQIKDNSPATGAAHSESVPGRKKIIIVAQGTLAVDYNDLIIPTIQGLEGRDDIILVAILGVKGATLDQYFPKGLPTNTMVVDYFPYGKYVLRQEPNQLYQKLTMITDPLIQHSDVFVNNGSYGAFSHAVAHGVPMVLAGHSEDKPEIGMRGERAGFAVNLRTGTPTPEMVAVAIDRVLTESSFKRRAMELKKEAEEFTCLETVERELRALF